LTVRRRLPGILVDRSDPPPPESLPRMDVAVFVGFAARGPCHRAVAVESVAAFEAVFGGDLPLVADTARGEMLHANLPASVRAFFSNGGRRCWVIRTAMTEDLAAAWAGHEGLEPAPAADRATFALPGVLSRAPTGEGRRSRVRPALLAARSLGSWSDDVTLSARCVRRGVTIEAPRAWRAMGFSFPNRDGLAPGDMIELAVRSGASIRYAKVVRVADGTAWALWIAAFVPLPADGADETGRARIAGNDRIFDARLEPGTDGAPEATLRITEPAETSPLVVGHWAKFERQGKADWLRIEHIDPLDGLTAFGRAWRQVGSRMPEGPFTARLVTLEIAETDGGDRRMTGPFGLAREHPAAIHRLRDDDAFYAPLSNRTATARAAFALTGSEETRLAAAAPRPEAAALAGTEAFTAADRVALRTGWLPLGLGESFGPAAAAISAPGTALERNGLAANDHRVFLDPRLAALPVDSLAGEAERLRDLAEEQLFGIHAAIDIPGDLHSPASLIAAPDACQQAWRILPDLHQPPAPKSPAPRMDRWTNHRGGCPPADPSGDGPDWSRFLDSETEVLAAPGFASSPVRSANGSYTLTWPEQPAGTVAILEESSSFDFSAATEVLRAADTGSFTVSDRSDGVYYYRLRIERAGNSSGYSLHRIVVRSAGDAIVDSAAPTGERTRRIQLAMLRLAAATGDLFSILSLPRDCRAEAATAHARALMQLAPGAGGALQLGRGEERALSFGALYHPWLATGEGVSISAAAPDGAVAGLYAARALARGAWIAPASEALRDIVGLDPSLPEGDLAGLDAARINLIRRLPAGFAVLDEDTLSAEPEWRAVHVRRLMMLIRRAALRGGMPFVFEPNGPVARRALERSVVLMLDELQGRGAFASTRPGAGYRVVLPEAANDRENGRLVVEIAVSPAAALRTLVLRLSQAGSRLTIREVA